MPIPGFLSCINVRVDLAKTFLSTVLLQVACHKQKTCKPFQVFLQIFQSFAFHVSFVNLFIVLTIAFCVQLLLVFGFTWFSVYYFVLVVCYCLALLFIQFQSCGQISAAERGHYLRFYSARFLKACTFLFFRLYHFGPVSNYAPHLKTYILFIWVQSVMFMLYRSIRIKPVFKIHTTVCY